MSPLVVCPAGRFGGFSNRVKSLVSASLMDEEYRVYWGPEGFCGLRYADIFRDVSREIDHVPVDSVLLDTWRFELPIALRELLPTGFSDCSTEYRGISFAGDSQGKTIDFEFLRIPEPILTALQSQFGQLRFTEEILARVRTLLRDMPRRFVGVHARTWSEDQARRQKWFNFDDFVQVCSRFHHEELFVASDDPAFIRDLSRALGRRLSTINESEARTPKPWYQNSPEEMLDDIVELLVLSHSSQLVLTPISTYSEVAWLLGGCTDEVYFADPAFRDRGHATRVLLP